MQDEIEVKIRLDDDSLMPIYGSQGASGADVRAKLDENLVCQPQESCLVATGVFLEIPKGYEVQIRPRSGLAFKHQMTVLNTPGTIDADYRGEIKVIMINHGKTPFVIEPGMRIAQLVLQKVSRAEFVRDVALSNTDRSDGGFGSTGLN